MKRLFILFVLLVAQASYGQSPECVEALKSYFSSSVDNATASEFLKLQGQITLHRLAWAHLKTRDDSQKANRVHLEQSIISLLNEKYSSKDPDFIKLRNEYEAQPLARTTLARVAPYVKHILSEQAKEKNEDVAAYLLTESDLKLLDVLALQEEAQAKGGQYDHRQFKETAPQSILNFTKIINSSYSKLDQLTGEEEQKYIDLNLKKISDVLHDLQVQLVELMNKLTLPQECEEYAKSLSCQATDTSFSSIFQQSEELQKAAWGALQERLGSDDALYSGLRYGEFWLHVRLPQSQVSPAPSTVYPLTPSGPSKPRRGGGSRGQSGEGGKPSQVVEEGESDNRYTIADPVSVIVKDRQGRTAASWKTFDKEYLQDFAHAIVKDQKTFIHKGKLYDRKTGKRMNASEALGVLTLINPMLASQLSKKEPEFVEQLAHAFLNKIPAFMLNDKLYSSLGYEMNPTDVIIKQRKKDLGVNRTAKDYAGMEKGFLAANALAILRKETSFHYKGKHYDTATGRSKTSPFLRKPAADDYSNYRQERTEINRLADEDVIRNWHRDNTKDAGPCGVYTIVDKKNAQVKVYRHDGTLIFQREALMGVSGSDKRTKFIDYTLKTSNQSTGAGIYTIGELKNNHDYYKRNYDGNLFNLYNQNNAEEKALAIHQIPVGSPERYNSFGNDDLTDNHITGGCINLKKSDFLEYKKHVGPGCTFYVLPEQEGFRFVLKNGKLNFTTDNAVSTQDLNDYNFKSHKNHYPIDIQINDQSANTQTSREFVKALEDEKEKIMSKFGIDNDDYNDMAMVAFGILGNESEFGQSFRLKMKENNQFLVRYMKAVQDDPTLLLPRLGITGPVKLAEAMSKQNPSRGLTQIKDLPTGLTEVYPEIKESNLTNPRNAAIATMAYLADAIRQLKAVARTQAAKDAGVKITRDNLVDFVGYIYQGKRWMLSSEEDPATPERNIYIQNLKKHMSKIELRQKMD